VSATTRARRGCAGWRRHGVAAALLILFAAPTAASESAAPALRVTLDEYTIGMPDSLPPGPRLLRIVNVGQSVHNLAIVGPGLEVALPYDLQAGARDSLRVTFRPGRYRVYCPVDDHARYGMAMTLTVAADAAPAPAAREHAEDGEAHEHGEGGEAHEHGEAPTTFLDRLRLWLGKFHPPAVNFPVALMVAAALVELAFLRTRRPELDAAARLALWGGGLGALLAGVLGWFMAGFRLTDGEALMTAHRWTGTVTVIVSVLALILSERSRRHGTSRAPYRTFLFLGAFLVLANGFLGGSLVFGLDHYAWPG